MCHLTSNKASKYHHNLSCYSDNGYVVNHATLYPLTAGDLADARQIQVPAP